MSKAIVKQQEMAGKIESVLVKGDLSKLTEEERVGYYRSICESIGVNPLTKPFEYITLSGRLTLYARRDCTDQLRKLHGVSVDITSRENFDGVFVVTAKATDKSGRYDASTGAVSIKGLSGEALANALMKAETKAKRRVTLSVCGLGMLDETEIETIPAAQTVKVVTNEARNEAPSTPDAKPTPINPQWVRVMDAMTKRGATEDRAEMVIATILRKRNLKDVDEALANEIVVRVNGGELDKHLEINAATVA